MTDKRITIKQFPRITPQPWKPNKQELQDYEDALNDDPTVEYTVEDYIEDEVPEREWMEGWL